jgi:hypothetical protein
LEVEFGIERYTAFADAGWFPFNESHVKAWLKEH